MKEFTFSVTHRKEEGPFPIDIFGTGIPNVLAEKISLSDEEDKYVFTVVCSEKEDPLEWAFHIGRAVQEKRHALLMKDYIDEHLKGMSN